MRRLRLLGWVAALLLALAGAGASAQAPPAPATPWVEVPHFVGDAAREHRNLVPHMAWLEDPTQALDLAGAMASERWQPVQGPSLHPGVSRSAFWLRIALVNPTPVWRDLVVHFGTSRQDNLQWFVVTPDGAEVRRGRLGDLLPMGERDLPTRGLAVPLSLHADARVLLFVRASSHDGWNYYLRPVLVSQDLFLRDAQRGDFFGGLLFGATLSFAVLGLWGWLATGNRSGLFYAAFAVAGTGFTMCLLTSDLAYLWPNQPVWHKRFMYLSAAGTALAFAGFVITFLELRRHAPAWVTHGLQGLGVACVLSITPAWFGHIALTNRTSVACMLLVGVASAVAIWMACRRVRGAVWVAIGFAVPSTIMGLLVLHHFKWVAHLPFDLNAMALGNLSNILFCAIGLGRSLKHWRLQRLQAELAAEQAREQLRTQAEQEKRHDRLTGLPNRLAMDEWLQRRRDDPRPFALLHLGLGGFKAGVDQHGETAADQALLEAVRRATMLLGANDFLAHTLDDEFVLALHGADAAQATSLAWVLLSRLDQPVELDRALVSLHPRIGVATWPADAREPAALRQCAHLALQEARAAPHAGAGVQLYRQGSDQAQARRNQLLRDLAGAPTSGQLTLYYQPKLQVRSGRVDSAEALMRWQHPALGMVSPVEFIALAERAGRMHELTRWALDEAVLQMARWREQGVRLDVSVNLSVTDLQHRDLPEWLQQRLERHHLPASALTLEITETSAMHESDGVRRVLGELRGRGFSLSIDDFGTGYSSLAMLQRLPLAELKIDQSFVRPLARDGAEGHHAAIVRAATGMGHDLGLSVVCEGVETAEVAAQLTAWGCDVLQGYWLSRPLPPEALVAWLQARSPATTP